MADKTLGSLQCAVHFESVSQNNRVCAFTDVSKTTTKRYIEFWCQVSPTGDDKEQIARKAASLLASENAGYHRLLPTVYQQGHGEIRRETESSNCEHLDSFTRKAEDDKIHGLFVASWLQVKKLSCASRGVLSLSLCQLCLHSCTRLSLMCRSSAQLYKQISGIFCRLIELGAILNPLTTFSMTPHLYPQFGETF